MEHPGNEGTNIIFHDGYLYSTRHVRNGIRYFKCRNYRQFHCQASGKVVAGQFVVINAYHNHPTVEDNIHEREFKRQLREACVAERGTLKNIYERISTRNVEGALIVPFNCVRSSMLRWRRATMPNIPANLEELAEMLQTGEWARFSTCANGFFFSGSVVSDGNRAVIFGNQDFINNFMASPYVFIDGTFRVVPRRPNFNQILTVFATFMNHAFPIIHIFMERRTRALYDAVFEYVSRTFPNFVNETVITDYEVALVDSLRSSYPQASLKGCFFHFCQAVLRKAKTLGVVRQIDGNENGRILLRKYYALALLPPQMIIPAFESLQPENGELNDVFRGLHDYVMRQWIERVTPAHFSVFRQRHRTNNVMESYHRRLYSKLVRHPGVWDLLQTLIDIQNTAAIELTQLERHGTVFRIATKNVLFNARLDVAWNKLDDGRYSMADFLRHAVHLVEGLDRQFYQSNENVPDAEEDPVPEPMQPLLNLDPIPQNLERLIANNSPPPIFVLQPQVLPQVRRPLPPPLVSFNPNPQPEQVVPRAPSSIQMEPPPPLVFFNADPQPQSVVPRTPGPIQMEPPPLIFFNTDPQSQQVLPRVTDPIQMDPLPLIAYADPPVIMPRSVSIPPNIPIDSHTENVENFEPLAPPEYVPDRLVNTPSPQFIFPEIPQQVARLIAELGNEDGTIEHNIEHRWEPTMPITEFDDVSMSPSLRCPVCYLNKVQYVMPCGHAFCTSCTATLFNSQAPKCEICRADLHREPIPLFLTL